jgi:heat shock protein HtpX
MWCVSKIALGFLFVYYWMIHYDSQKAEYYADYLGASMGGSEDSEKSLYKLSYGLFLQYVQQQAVVAPNGKTIIQRLKEMIETIPEKEILRLQKLATRESSRVDSSHPPTTYRIEFVKKFAPKVGLFQLTQEHFHKICEELAQQEEKINIKLIDEYKWYIS